MTCEIKYLKNKPFESKATETHSEIHNNLLDSFDVYSEEVDGISYLKHKESFNPKAIIEKYGNVLSYDKDYLIINALQSKQYLDYKINVELLGIDKEFSNVEQRELVIEGFGTYVYDYGSINRDDIILTDDFDESRLDEHEANYHKGESEIILLPYNGKYLVIDGNNRIRNSEGKVDALILGHNTLENRIILSSQLKIATNSELVKTIFRGIERPNVNALIDAAMTASEGVTQLKNLAAKNDFSGKLIYALPGTGKSFATKNNPNIVDMDEVEKMISGKDTVQEANDYYDRLSDSDKKTHETQQEFFLNKALKEGKTVVTSRRSLIDRADIVITHNNIERLINSVASNDRENPYKYTKEKAGKLIKLTNKPNAIILKDGQYVSDLLDNNYSDKIDIKKEESKYPALEEYMKTLNYEQKVLLQTLLNKLQSVAPNFKIEVLDKLLENGDSAVTDFTESVIRIGSDADFSFITEEIMHVLVESIDPVYLEAFMGKIEHTKMYQEVVKIYANDPRYTPEKLRKEAIVRLVTQLSNNVPIEKYMTTSNQGILSSIQKAIRDLLKAIYNVFNKLDVDDFQNLTESIMYDSVPYVQRDLTHIGQMAHKNFPTVDATKFFQLGGKDLEDFVSVTFHHTSLFNSKEVNGIIEYNPTELGKEFMEIVKSAIETQNEQRLKKIKIYLPTSDRLKDGDTGSDSQAAFFSNIGTIFRDLGSNVIVDRVQPNTALVIPNLAEEASISYLENTGNKVIYSNKDKTSLYENGTEATYGNNQKTVIIKSSDDTYTKKVRFTEMTTEYSDYTEGLEFFNSLTDDRLNFNLRYIATSLEKDYKVLQELGLINSIDNNLHSISIGFIKSLQSFKAGDDITFKTAELHKGMKEYKEFFNDLEYAIINGKELTLAEYKQVQDSLKTWKTLVEKIQENLRNERSKPDSKPFEKYENFIVSFDNAIDNLNKILSTKSANEIALNISKTTDKFGESLDNDLAELKDKFERNGEIPANLKDLYLAELARLKETYDRHKHSYDDILNQLIQKGLKNDIDSNVSNFNLSPFFDKNLVNIRFSSDPILASFGQNMDEIYNKSDAELQTVLVNIKSLGQLITEEKGEVEVGKKLTKIVNTVEYKVQKTEVEINGELTIIDQQIPVNVIKKQYVNQWGNSDDYIISSYINSQNQIGTYGQLKAEIFNINKRINKNQLELNGVDLIKYLEKLLDTKYEFELKYFHKEYTEEYYAVEPSVIKAMQEQWGLESSVLKTMLKEANAEVRTKLNERNALESSLENLVVDGDRKRVVEIRSEIAKITADISKFYTVDSSKSDSDNIKAQMLDLIRTQKAEFREDILNEPLFLRDYNDLIKELDKDDNELIVILQSKVRDNTGKLLPFKTILSNMVELHRDLHKLDLTVNEELVKNFLERALWYKPMETFYDERNIIYNSMTSAGTFLRYNDYHSFINLVEPTEDTTYPDLELEATADAIRKSTDGFIISNNLSDFKRVDGVFPKGIYKYKVDNLWMAVVVEDGRPKKKLTADQSKRKETISELWEEIIGVTRKYRDKFGFIYSMSEEDQVSVSSKEQAIYEIMADLKEESIEADISHKLPKTIREALKTSLKSDADELGLLQEDYINESYWLDLKNVFATYNYSSMEEFRELSKITNDTAKFKSKFKQTVAKLNSFLTDTVIDDIRAGKTYEDFLQLDYSVTGKAKEFGNKTLDFKNMTEADYHIIKHIALNHVTKSHIDGLPVVVSYNNRKIIPRNPDHLEKKLDNKYRSREVKAEYKTSTKTDRSVSHDYKGDFQLKTDLLNTPELYGNDVNSSNYILANAHSKLSGNLEIIYNEFVVKQHIGNQRLAADDDVDMISENSLVGYTVPYVEKQYSELNWLQGLRAFGRELVGLRNPNESGDIAIVDGGDPNVITTPENKEKKTFNSILNLFTSALTKFINRTGTTIYAFRNQKYIPVDYTHYKNGNDITDNVFLASTSYLSSLIKAKIIAKDYYKITTLRETLEKNNPFEGQNRVYKRLEILNENIDSEIFRNNIGDENIITKILRVFKKLMVYKSQSIFNIAGNVKNLEAGLIQNYIQSINVPDRFIWDKNSRVASDLSSTKEAFKMALESFGFNSKNLNEESFVQFLARNFNPQAKNINDLVRNTDRHHKKNLIFGEKLIFGGLKVGETVVSYQLMIDILKRISFNYNGGTIKFLDMFDKVDNNWVIKKGVTDNEGKQIDMTDFVDVKRMIDLTRFQTMGHSQFKGTIFNNTYVRSLFYFVNYLVPLMQGMLVTQRRDYVTNQVVDNFNIAFLNYIAKSLQYALQGQWYWSYMTTHERRNTTKAIVSYTTLFSLVLVMRYLFNFDPDDKDAYKKLKSNNLLQNFLLITTLKTASELEQQNIFNPLSKTRLPVITANYNAIRNPTLAVLIGDIAKTGQLAFDAGWYGIGIGDRKDVFYDKKMPQFDIDKGDMKLIHAIKKFLPYKTNSFDFIDQVRAYQQMSNK